MKISGKCLQSSVIRFSKAQNCFPLQGLQVQADMESLRTLRRTCACRETGWCLGTQTMATLPYRWDMRGFWSIGQLVSSKTRGPPWLILSRESNHSRIYFHFWYCDKTQPTHANKIISYREIFRAGHSNKAKFLLFQDFFCTSSRIMWITRIFSLCLLS